jgi:hypothetical protein
MKNFKLRIELGNEAMQTPEDVVRALRDVAERLEGYSDFHSIIIRDVNGNTVGKAEAR